MKPAPKATPRPYVDKLGKDGKLTPEEKKRRWENHLCLFCGGAGHTVETCPKKAAAAKARAAEVTSDPEVEEEAESESVQDDPKN